MTRLLVLKLSNNSNPNGIPVTTWVNADDSFATAIANPLKVFKVAPKGYTWKLFLVTFWMGSLTVFNVDTNAPLSINLDLNLWNEHKHQKGSGESHERIARARVEYNKFIDNNVDATTWSISPGTGDVFTGTRDVAGSIRNSMRNTNWISWRPTPTWAFSGLIVAPYLYFSVTHGGNNNAKMYGTVDFSVSIEYELVPRLRWQELPFKDN